MHSIGKEKAAVQISGSDPEMRNRKRTTIQIEGSFIAIYGLFGMPGGISGEAMKIDGRARLILIAPAAYPRASCFLQA